MGVDLADYVQPVEQILASADRWFVDAKPILDRCGIPTTFKGTMLAAQKQAAQSESAESEAAPMDVDAPASDEPLAPAPAPDERANAEALDDQKKVEMARVMACIAAADTVGLDLPEVDKLRSLVQQVGKELTHPDAESMEGAYVFWVAVQVEKWQEHLAVTCPQRLSKRRTRAKVTIEELVEILKEGEKFPIDVSEEAVKIQDRVASTASWQQQVRLTSRHPPGSVFGPDPTVAFPGARGAAGARDRGSGGFGKVRGSSGGESTCGTEVR
jgi:hypothetical protein